MVRMHVCPRCEYTTTEVFDMKRHLTRVNPCPPVHSDAEPLSILKEVMDEANNKKKTICQHCGAGFSCRQSKYAHIRRFHSDCKGAPGASGSGARVNTNHVVGSASVTNNVTNNVVTNNNVTNIGQQVNLTINAFGRENTDALTSEFVQQCVRRTDVGLLQLLKFIHFNEDVPENQNVKIASVKRGEMQVFDGERWSYRPQDRVITDMIHTGHGIMQDHFDDHEDEMRNRMRQSLFDHIQRWLDGVQNDEQKYVRPLVREVLALIRTYTEALRPKQ